MVSLGADRCTQRKCRILAFVCVGFSPYMVMVGIYLLCLPCTIVSVHVISFWNSCVFDSQLLYFLSCSDFAFDPTSVVPRREFSV